MAVEFLSAEWCKAVSDAVNSDANFKASAGSIQITIQQTVTGAPSGEVTYYIAIKDGQCTMELGAADNPDLGVTEDYATGVALSKGDLNLQSAFMQGKVRITGNLAVAMQYQPQLQALESALKTVEVDYPNA